MPIQRHNPVKERTVDHFNHPVFCIFDWSICFQRLCTGRAESSGMAAENQEMQPIHQHTLHPSKGLVVFPRRKLTVSGIQDIPSSYMAGLSHPVVITLELLQSLTSLPSV